MSVVTHRRVVDVQDEWDVRRETVTNLLLVIFRTA